jgi:DNA-binding response OmpR family regulator
VRVRVRTEVWGHSAAVLTRTVDTHIAELRRKLEEDPAKPRQILAVRKAGYRLDA